MAMFHRHMAGLFQEGSYVRPCGTFHGNPNGAVWAASPVSMLETHSVSRTHRSKTSDYFRISVLQTGDTEDKRMEGLFYTWSVTADRLQK